MVWLPLWSEIGSSFIKTGACVHEHTGRTCLSLRNDNPKWVHSWNHHILVSMITIFNMVWNREIVKSNLSSKGSCKTYVWGRNSTSSGHLLFGPAKPRTRLQHICLKVSRVGIGFSCLQNPGWWIFGFIMNFVEVYHHLEPQTPT